MDVLGVDKGGEGILANVGKMPAKMLANVSKKGKVNVSRTGIEPVTC